MKKKIMRSILVMVLVISSMLETVQAAKNDVIANQLGFELDTNMYGQIGYIINNSFSAYYGGKIAGTTTYSYVYARAKKKSSSYNSDMCMMRLLTEPNTITVAEKNWFGITSNKTYKFGIKTLNVESDKSKLSDFKLNNYKVYSTADKAVDTYSSSSNIGVSLPGISVSYSSQTSVTKSVVDIDLGKSTRTKLDVSFGFNKPTTIEQKERVYEQTYYYIIQNYLNNRNSYNNETTLTSSFLSENGNKTATYKLTIKTPLSFK